MVALIAIAGRDDWLIQPLVEVAPALGCVRGGRGSYRAACAAAGALPLAATVR